MYTVDFFRNGPCYYKITEKIDTESLSCKDIASLPVENILLISKCVCHSLRILHDLGVVHGDLKPDNILIKKTSSSIFAAKLIDFDDSYIDGLPPASKNIVGTPEYYSPELAAYIMDEDGEVDGRTLTVKSDIFTLGIILCEYFTGEKPIVEASYKNVWNSVSHGVAPTFPCHLRSDVSALLRKMLHKDPTRRPTIHEVFDTLKKMKKHAPVPKSPETVPATGGLRGKGIAIAKK